VKEWIPPQLPEHISGSMATANSAGTPQTAEANETLNNNMDSSIDVDVLSDGIEINNYDPNIPDNGWNQANNQRQQRKNPLERVNSANNGNENTRNPTNRGRIITVAAQGTLEERAKFMSQSQKMMKLLAASKFAQAGIEDIRTNFVRKSISVLIKNEVYVEELIQMKTLGSYQIQVSQPTSHWEIKGIIGPIGTDTTMDEIIEDINEQNEKKITQAIRLTKGKEKEPSLSIKLIFDKKVKELPRRICMNYQSFPVRESTDKPIQCFKCQAYGHPAKYCIGKEVCVVCAGDHKLSDCTNTVENNKPKCANCGKDHTASYRGCTTAKEAKKINDIRIEKKITYSEAVKERKRQTEETPEPEEKTVKNSEIPAEVRRTSTPKAVTTVGCQTSEVRTTQTIEAEDGKPDEKICAFILECVKSLWHKPTTTSTDEQIKVISEVSQRVYGTTVNENKISQFLRQKQGQKNKHIATSEEEEDCHPHGGAKKKNKRNKQKNKVNGESP
jgi:hypothetical protein